MAQIKQRVEKACDKLDPRSRKVLEGLFGLNGGAPLSSDEIAAALGGIDPKEVEKLQADALRALAGYGPKVPGKVDITGKPCVN